MPYRATSVVTCKVLKCILVYLGVICLLALWKENCCVAVEWIALNCMVVAIAVLRDASCCWHRLFPCYYIIYSFRISISSSDTTETCRLNTQDPREFGVSLEFRW